MTARPRISSTVARVVRVVASSSLWSGGGLLFGVSILGCDSARYDCAYRDEPIPGAQRDQCPPSAFVIPSDAHWRDVLGILRRGESPVENAVIRVEPSPLYRSDATTRTFNAVTDRGGFFGPLSGAAFQYDVSFRDGDEILAYQGVISRYIFPSFEPMSGSRSNLDRAWTARVEVRLDAPLGATETLTFMVNDPAGRNIDVVGSHETGLTVVGLDVDFSGTLHAFVHDKSGGLVSATRYAKADFAAHSGGATTVELAFAPITDFREATFTTTTPRGIAPTSIDLLVGYSRTCRRPFGSFELGKKHRLPILPNLAYVNGRVSVLLPDGSKSDSGEKGVDIFKGEPVTLVMPAPPTVEGPPDGAQSGEPIQVSAGHQGVIEHVLTPISGAGPRVRLVTSARSAQWPSTSLLGVSLEGDYRWVAQTYSEITLPESLGGNDRSRFLAVAAAAPRTLRFPSSQ